MTFLPFLSVLKNADAIIIREVTAKDRHLLAIGYSSLSLQSRSLRFQVARKNLTLAELDGFTVLTGPDCVSVGALLEDSPIGVARFVRLSDQDHSAEIEITIIEAYQNLGLGRLLLGALSQFADISSISEFIALIDGDNMAMLKLPGSPGAIRTAIGEAEIEVRVPVAKICAQSIASSVSAGNARKPQTNNLVVGTGSFPLQFLEHWANLRLFVPVSEETAGIVGAD